MARSTEACEYWLYTPTQPNRANLNTIKYALCDDYTMRHGDYGGIGFEFGDRVSAIERAHCLYIGTLFDLSLIFALNESIGEI